MTGVLYNQHKKMNYSKVNVQMSFSCSVMSDSLWPNGLHHARFPCPSPSPRVCSSSCPLSWWCHQCNIQITTWFFVCVFVFCVAFFFFFKGRDLSHTHGCVCSQSCLTLCDFLDCRLPSSSVHCPSDFPGKNAWMNCHFLPQGSSWPRNQTHVSCILLLIPG